MSGTDVPVLVLHGGAGNISRGRPGEAAARRTMLEALRTGHDLLAAGGPALEAVVAAVQVLESSGDFNAGKGAVRASDGSVSHDAAVMDGRSRRAGGVAALEGFGNPVLVARAVMERTPHVLLADRGAQGFAEVQGFARAPEGYFVPADSERAPVSPQGTVGAVALDATGGLAVATSTGGVRGKLPGRVGDSPLIGAGTYADDRVAISATGTGEMFVRAVFGFRVAMLLRSGQSLEQASRAALDEVTALGGSGGCVAVTSSGQVVMPFTTPGMFRGVVDGQGRLQVAVFPDET